jgi:hypothetical protein
VAANSGSFAEVQALQSRVNELTAAAQEARSALRLAEQKVAEADNRAAEAEAGWMQAEDGLDKALGVSSEADGLDQQLKQVRGTQGLLRAGPPWRRPMQLRRAASAGKATRHSLSCEQGLHCVHASSPPSFAPLVPRVAVQDGFLCQQCARGGWHPGRRGQGGSAAGCD